MPNKELLVPGGVVTSIDVGISRQDIICLNKSGLRAMLTKDLRFAPMRAMESLIDLTVIIAAYPHYQIW